MLKRFSFALAILFLFPIVSLADDVSAQSAIVIDADTQTVLYEKNAYEKRAMASTTKIMTALLAVESDLLDTTVTIKSEMLNTIGSCLGLRDGDELTFYDLVVGMMLTSGNDCANSVAYLLSGSIDSFVQLMNKRAQEIGMTNTVFVTPSGLDEGEHHSTAYDMALLTSVAIENQTFCDIVSKKSAQIKINSKTLTVYNHNKLLSMDDSVFGVKTGYTDKAGRCLVSAKKYNNSTLICVTLNAPDDWNDHISLYTECENKYNKVNLCSSLKLNVVGAQVDYVKCSYSYDFYTVGSITKCEYYLPFSYAPIKKGDELGYVIIYCNDKIIERLPIEADEDVEYYAEQE